jgi:hypothetical protein
MTFKAVYSWGDSCKQCPVNIDQILKSYEFITFWLLKRRKSEQALTYIFILEFTVTSYVLHSLSVHILAHIWIDCEQMNV